MQWGQFMKNKIRLINEFVQKNRWIDIEFKTINHNEITLRCGANIDLPGYEHLLITFTNPSFIKSDLWIRSTLSQTQNSVFVSIVAECEAKKIMIRDLDKENKELGLAEETLFKIQVSDSEYSFIAAENISYKINK